MTFIVGLRDITGDLNHEIRRLEGLLAHLKLLASGGRPPTEEIDAAPIIDGYGPAIRHFPCLVGHLIGHPTAKGLISATSDLWTLAPDLGWARTMSRLYRLGRASFYPSTLQ